MEDNETKKDEPRRNSATGTPQLMRNIFGIIMIIVYIGMGILLFINFFQFDASFTWVRWVMGSLFIIYGIWRGYRQAKGIDSNL